MKGAIKLGFRRYDSCFLFSLSFDRQFIRNRGWSGLLVSFSIAARGKRDGGEVGADGDFVFVEAVVGVDDLPARGIGEVVVHEVEIQPEAASLEFLAQVSEFAFLRMADVYSLFVRHGIEEAIGIVGSDEVRWLKKFHSTRRFQFTDQQLRRRRIQTIVLCGIATNIGVESTARAAFDRGYELVLAEDAMTSVSAEAHGFSVKNLFPRMGRVRRAEEIVKALG